MPWWDSAPFWQAQLRMARCREEALAPLEEGVDAPRAELSAPFWKALEYRLLVTLIRTETTLDHSSGMAPTVGLLEELPCLGGTSASQSSSSAASVDRANRTLDRGNRTWPALIAVALQGQSLKRQLGQHGYG